MVGMDLPAICANRLFWLDVASLRSETDKHPPAFGITHKAVAQRGSGAFDRRRPGFALSRDALATVQCRHDFPVTISKTNAGESQVFALADQGIWQSQGQAQAAILLQSGLTTLAPG